jgi:integrase
VAGRSGRRDFGSVRKLPSGRWQAFYADPDGRTAASKSGKVSPVRHSAPNTFETKRDAEAWLVDEYRLISSGAWTSVAERQAAKLAAPLTFGEYAESWLVNRKSKGRPLADRTREHYRALLDAYVLPTFADVPLASITPEMVDRWYELVAVGKDTTRAHAYSLLRTILGTAVDRRLIVLANPARVRGGGTTNRAKKIKPATLEQLETIATTVPERHRLMVLLGAWCALRFGELAELRRHDVDTKSGDIHVRRGVVRTSEGPKVKKPKTDAGVRDVSIPPHLMPAVRQHLLEHAAPGRDGLLFPGSGGGHMSPSSFYGRAARFHQDGSVKSKGWGYYEARRAAGREDLNFHALRHTGATLAAQTGATLAELMNRLGHSTAGAAMRYQHAAQERDREIARRLSAIAEGEA